MYKSLPACPRCIGGHLLIDEYRIDKGWRKQQFCINCGCRPNGHDPLDYLNLKLLPELNKDSGRARIIDNYMAKKIRELHQEGMSLRAIADVAYISRETVRAVIHKSGAYSKK